MQVPPAASHWLVGQPGGNVCGLSAGFGQKTHCEEMHIGDPSAGHEQTFGPFGTFETSALYALCDDALIDAVGQLQL